MKKFSITLLFFLFSSVHALPVGNPAEASFFYFDCCEEPPACSLFHLRVGFYGDYVFNRHMETDHGKDINTTELFTNAGYLAVIINERIEVFTSLGVSRLALNTNLGAFNAVDPHPLFEIESGSDFSYSAGGRITIFEYKCATFGIEGQYFATTPNIKRAYIASGAVIFADDLITTRYSEWQVGGGIAYRYNNYFIPYATLQYARSHWKLDNGRRFVIESNVNTFLFNLRNQKNWGYAIGLTLSPPVCEHLAVTVEGRFSAEKALYVNAQLQF